MKIYTEQSIANFEAWSGAKATKQTIIDNDKEAEFDMLIEDLYPDGIDETQLNDILWVESELVYEMLGISEEEEEEEETVKRRTGVQLPGCSNAIRQTQ